MGLSKSIRPKELSDFLRDKLSDIEGLTDAKINQVSKAFYEEFGHSDLLPSPFQQDIFYHLGAYLKYFKWEPVKLGKESIYHFEFYLLDQPDKTGSFTLSQVNNTEIVTSKAKFTAFVKEQIMQAVAQA